MPAIFRQRVRFCGQLADRCVGHGDCLLVRLSFRFRFRIRGDIGGDLFLLGRGGGSLLFERAVKMSERRVRKKIVMNGAILRAGGKLPFYDGIHDDGFRARQIAAARDQHDAGEHEQVAKV